MQMEAEVRKTWFDQNWKWAVPLIALASLAVLACFVGLILYGVMTMMKSSEPYQSAIQAAAQHPRVIAGIGAPVKPGFLTSGSLNLSGPSGHASLAIPIHGPNGEATVFVEANKVAGEWRYVHKVVQMGKTGERINLDGVSL
jgi:hypothetical protein